jgi:hypothetical protein
MSAIGINKYVAPTRFIVAQKNFIAITISLQS